jgi:hypothetical protein
MEPTPAEIVHDAIDALLLVVAKSAEDLNAFQAAVAQARLGPLPPFPRATLGTAERIIDHLKRVEQDLRELLVNLGLAP